MIALMRLLKSEKGFSLVEGIVAMAILTIGSVALMNLFVIGARLNNESEDRTIATNIAQEKLEEIINSRFRYIVANYPPGITALENLPHEEPYWTLNSKDEWVPALSEGQYEIDYPDGLDADPLRISITVSWEG